MKKVQHFLWWCAGAKPHILEHCPTDHAKYFGIGGTILFTALMASFAGGYAFYTAFQNTLLGILFGAFWGMLIFNLDRYIVATVGIGDGTTAITKEEWFAAAPRLTMALLLGFVIATPLELKIFEPEIKTVVERLKIDKAEELKGRDVSFNSDLDANKERLSKIESDIQNFTDNKKKYLVNAITFIEERKQELAKDSKLKGAELNEAQQKFNTAQANYLFAYKDTTGRYTQAQINDYKTKKDNSQSYRNKISEEKRQIDEKIQAIENDKESAIKEEAAKIDKQINLLVTEKESLMSKIQDMDKTKESKRKSYENKVENYDGFAAHLEAMSILTQEKSAIFWSKWLITLLFIFIEIAPVLFKLMTESGPYDEIVERMKHEIKVAEKQRISDINDKINTDILISTEKNKVRLDAELNGNKELLQSISLAQADIAKRAVEKWKERELKKLDKSLAHIIQSNHKDDIDFIDKFWSDANKDSEYYFRNSKINEILFKENNLIKSGKWNKVAPNQIEIELDNAKMTFAIEELTDTHFKLSELGTGNKIHLTTLV
jgi:hypothetical protein